MAPSQWWRWWLRLGLGIYDEIPVAHRIVSDGEFQHAVEDKPPASGLAAVEAEHELIEVLGEVVGFDCTLMRPK